MGNTQNRIMLTYYPTYQQTTEYTCGPAAALTVLYYYGNHAYDEMSLAKIMKTNDKTGTSLFSMVNFFKGIGWNVRTGFGSAPFATYDDFKKFTQDTLKEGTPIMVENVEKFYSMWFDHSMLPQKERNQPWLIAQPERATYKESAIPFFAMQGGKYRYQTGSHVDSRGFSAMLGVVREIFRIEKLLSTKVH